MTNLLITILLFNGISGKIQGVVKNEETGEPIAYANVTVLDIDTKAATDENGNFYILSVPSGYYKIEISCLGYQKKFIDNIIVEIDQTTRLIVFLKPTLIEMMPITITGERPGVTKDMVGTTYIVRKAELAYLPVDQATKFVVFQPAVTNVDTTIHVRGGRATEVQYMIDNVSIIDPQTGDLAINLSKGIIDEIIFLPGSFDAEYGRAMSGVINMITTRPADNLQLTTSGKTERIMPLYYDFGYENIQTSLHLPASKRFKGIFSLDVTHTDDWNPKLYKLNHKQRDDYALYSKWLFVPSTNLKISLSGIISRTQFDRYDTKWKFNLDHYRSDLRQGNLAVLDLNYLPNTRYLFNITLSRLDTKLIYGVKEEDPQGIFKNFAFRNHLSLRWPTGGINNPFGVYYAHLPLNGDYPEYEDKRSLVMKANVNANLQIHDYHELRTGAEYSYLDLKNFNYFISDTLHQLIDEYHHYPKEYVLYLQDNIDYKGLYAKIGCRYDYFASDIKDISPKIIFSPRLGFSFMVTEKFLFRTNIGKYAQPPLYDYMYAYYSLIPFPSYIDIPIIGNPDLKPEKTTSYEIGLQGEIQKNLIATINTFYKDVSDLAGTRFVRALPRSYVSYFNVEYVNVKGIETILEFRNSIFTGKVSYTLSYATGSSSYAEEVYYRYYYENPDTNLTPPMVEYALDFDQRHRFFIQGIMSLPQQIQFYLYGYIGNGLPYTPPGGDKEEQINYLRFPMQKQFDCVITKSFELNGISLNANIEIINLLDQRYEIAQHYPLIPLEEIKPWDFTTYIPLNSNYYNPAADQNHDGVITPYEEYTSFRGLVEATDDWVNAYSSPRRARIGLTINL